MLVQPSNKTSFDSVKGKLSQYFFIEALQSCQELIRKHLLNNKPLSCIFSYAWGEAKYEYWVVQFALELEQAGFKVYLDIWFDKKGKDLNEFIKKFDLKKVNYILPVGTELYLKKAERRVQTDEEREHVVAMEVRLMEYFIGYSVYLSDRILPIVLEGTAETSLPLFMRPKLNADFVRFNSYEQKFELIRSMAGIDNRNHECKQIKERFFNQLGQLKNASEEQLREQYTDILNKELVIKIAYNELKQQQEKIVALLEQAPKKGNNIPELLYAKSPYNLIDTIREFHNNNLDISYFLLKYISSDVKDNLQLPKRKALQQEVLNFINGDQTVLALLGDSGSGKSSFTYYLEDLLLKSFRHLGFIPVRIECKNFTTSTIKEAIKTTLKNDYPLNDSQIAELQRNNKFIFLIDGYDELKGGNNFPNLYDSMGLSHWNAKTIITCRTQFFTSQVRLHQHFIPTLANNRLKAKYQELYLLPFTPEQINNYINTQDIDLIDRQRIDDLLKKIPYLSKLLSNPFILSLFLETVSYWEKRFQETNLAMHSITRSDIFHAFIVRWFDKEELRLVNIPNANLEASPDTSSEQSLIDIFNEFAQDLAWTMLLEDKEKIIYQPSNLKLKRLKQTIPSDKLSHLFAENRESRIACPIKRIDDYTYTFLHKSLQEYFIACYILSLSSQQLLDALDKLPLQMGIIDFIVDEIQQERLVGNNTKAKQLLEIIKATKTSKLKYAGANAITILVRAKVSLSGQDLSYTNLAGANLSNGIFHQVNFTGANLQRAILHRAYLVGTCFKKANTKHASFGIKPALTTRISEFYPNFGVHPFAVNYMGNALVTVNRDGKKLEIRLLNENNVVTKLSSVDYPFLSIIKRIKFSQDGRFILAYNDKQLQLWQATSNQLSPYSLIKHYNCEQTEFFKDADILSAESKVVMVTIDGGYPVIKVINIINQQEKKIVIKDIIPQYLACHSSALNYNDKMLVIGTSNVGIYLIDIEGEKAKQVFDTKECVIELAFSPDMQYLAAGTNQGNIYLLDSINYEVRCKFSEHSNKNRLSSLSFSQNSCFLASSAEDYNVCVFNIENKALVTKMRQNAKVLQVAIDSSNQELILSTTRGEIKFENYQFDESTIYMDSNEHQSWIRKILILKDENLFITSDLLNNINVWRLADGELIKRIEFGGKIADFMHNQNKVFILTETAQLIVLDVKTLEKINEYSICNLDKPKKLAGINNILIIANNEEARIHQLNQDSISLFIKWNHKHNLTSPNYKNGAPKEHFIKSLAYMDEQDLIITSGEDGYVRFWVIKEDFGIREIEFDCESENIVFAIHPTGHYVAISANKKIEIIDITNIHETTYKPIRIKELSGDTVYTTSLSYSPDGKTLMVAGMSGNITLHSYSNSITETYTTQQIGAHKLGILVLDFYSNDNFLSTDNKNNIKHWSYRENKTLLNWTLFNELFLDEESILTRTRFSENQPEKNQEREQIKQENLRIDSSIIEKSISVPIAYQTTFSDNLKPKFINTESESLKNECEVLPSEQANQDNQLRRTILLCNHIFGVPRTLTPRSHTDLNTICQQATDKNDKQSILMDIATQGRQTPIRSPNLFQQLCERLADSPVITPETTQSDDNPCQLHL